MAEALYDVAVLGFRPASEEPELAMMRVFGIDAALARRVLERAPVVVKHRVPLEVARQFEQALQAVGADVALRPCGAEPRPESSPPATRISFRAVAAHESGEAATRAPAAAGPGEGGSLELAFEPGVNGHKRLSSTRAPASEPRSGPPGAAGSSRPHGPVTSSRPPGSGEGSLRPSGSGESQRSPIGSPSSRPSGAWGAAGAAGTPTAPGRLLPSDVQSELIESGGPALSAWRRQALPMFGLLALAVLLVLRSFTALIGLAFLAWLLVVLRAYRAQREQLATELSEVTEVVRPHAFRYARVYERWARHAGFTHFTVYDVRPGAIMAVFRHGQRPLFFSVLMADGAVHWQLVSNFDHAVTFTSTTQPFLEPPVRGAYHQSFPVAPLDVLWRKHQEGHDYLLAQGKVLPGRAPLSFHEQLKQGARRKREALAAVPFWPLRLLPWALTMPRRYGQRSIAELITLWE